MRGLVVNLSFYYSLSPKQVLTNYFEYFNPQNLFRLTLAQIENLTLFNPAQFIAAALALIKKMKHLTITFIAFIISTTAFSQEIRIFTNALRNIDLSHPEANIGIELKRNKNSISLTTGYFLYNFMFQEKSNGFSIGTEYKLHKENSFYYAINLNYSKVTYQTSNSFKKQSDSLDIYPTYLDDYEIKKSRFDISAKIGYRIDIKKIYLDCFGGIGLRIKDTQHFNRSNPNDEFDPVFRQINIRDKEGQLVVPILKLGILIGLKIK